MKLKEEWLEGFRNDNTRKKYRSNLKNFEDFIDEDIDEYLNRTEDDQVWEDLKKFANFLMEEDYAPKTVHGRHFWIPSD
ncbi:hypothetical protein AKJ39_01230 [candidate division MSBL1 archaeon SCGC-AAA259J03]|uniref:Core-binding (CB) domain-containing protein n=1 Tax=candidate division MSBL1 archaeon SCGC-AAA259J03 TaxID=1698269 RepID=A0A656YXI1_9EURY|nr:hypothetical protein AKJ39_01230 [candidate division MSBL1 archaeon SCGC-AAA259J03]